MLKICNLGEDSFFLYFKICTCSGWCSSLLKTPSNNFPIPRREDPMGMPGQRMAYHLKRPEAPSSTLVVHSNRPYVTDGLLQDPLSYWWSGRCCLRDHFHWRAKPKMDTSAPITMAQKTFWLSFVSAQQKTYTYTQNNDNQCTSVFSLANSSF
jgi:hypothetical protein